MARVLVVDDDAGVVALERQVLERDGYEVVTASDGVEALAALREQTFGLVLLDITMPRVDGFQVATELRKDERHKRTPVIFLSARTDADATRDGFKAGGSMFLSKPFTAMQLSKIVKSMIRG